jgi:Protein of unknown function (DUF3297)
LAWTSAAHGRIGNPAPKKLSIRTLINLFSGSFLMDDDNPPDHLSNDPGSPFYNAAMLERGVGIRFKGVEKNNVEEYCVSEGWVRVAHATAKDRNGHPMTIRLTGTVEPYFRTGK